MRWIAQNGGVEGSIVVNKVRDSKGSLGYNAATDKYEDLLEAGVIDPTKVVRTALQNAASVAGLMLTTEAMIAEAEGRREAAGGHAEPRSLSPPRAVTSSVAALPPSPLQPSLVYLSRSSAPAQPLVAAGGCSVCVPLLPCRKARQAHASSSPLRHNPKLTRTARSQARPTRNLAASFHQNRRGRVRCGG